MIQTEVSDFMSSNEKFTRVHFYKIKNSHFKHLAKVSYHWVQKKSAFAILKGLEGLAGEPKSVKKLKNGSLLIECATECHSKNLLKAKTLCNIPINVTPHTTLNSSKRCG